MTLPSHRPRAIVRDPDVLRGRWRFAGTVIAIADVDRDYTASAASLPEAYRFAGLSTEEVQAALAFVFPALAEVGVTVEFASVAVTCACGEPTRTAFVWPMAAEVACPCRRRWRLAVEPIAENDPRADRQDPASA